MHKNEAWEHQKWENASLQAIKRAKGRQKRANWSQLEPTWSQRVTKGCKREPKGPQRDPKGSQREPKGTPKAAKWNQKGAKWCPKCIQKSIKARSPKKVAKKSPKWLQNWWFLEPFSIKNPCKNQCKNRCRKSHEKWWKNDAKMDRNLIDILLKNQILQSWVNL